MCRRPRASHIFRHPLSTRPKIEFSAPHSASDAVLCFKSRSRSSHVGTTAPLLSTGATKPQKGLFFHPLRTHPPTHPHTHRHTRTYTYTNTHTPTHTHTHSHKHTHLRTHKHTHTHKHTRPGTHIHTHPRKHNHAQTYTQTHTHAYIYNFYLCLL